jgi:hypothetical protein
MTMSLNLHLAVIVESLARAVSSVDVLVVIEVAEINYEKVQMHVLLLELIVYFLERMPIQGTYSS